MRGVFFGILVGHNILQRDSGSTQIGFEWRLAVQIVTIIQAPVTKKPPKKSKNTQLLALPPSPAKEKQKKRKTAT